MRRSSARILLALGALLGAVLIAPPAQASITCPAAGGAVCLYDSQNFNNIIMLIAEPSSTCTGTVNLGSWSNKTESVRNRTHCGVFLEYLCGTNTYCHTEYMSPYSEDGAISPPNAIDRIRYGT